jgi:hypothetical protein
MQGPVTSSIHRTLSNPLASPLQTLLAGVVLDLRIGKRRRLKNKTSPLVQLASTPVFIHTYKYTVPHIPNTGWASNTQEPSDSPVCYTPTNISTLCMEVLSQYLDFPAELVNTFE